MVSIKKKNLIFILLLIHAGVLFMALPVLAEDDPVDPEVIRAAATCQSRNDFVKSRRAFQLTTPLRVKLRQLREARRSPTGLTRDEYNKRFNAAILENRNLFQNPATEDAVQDLLQQEELETLLEYSDKSISYSGAREKFRFAMEDPKPETLGPALKELSDQINKTYDEKKALVKGTTAQVAAQLAQIEDLRGRTLLNLAFVGRSTLNKTAQGPADRANAKVEANAILETMFNTAVGSTAFALALIYAGTGIAASVTAGGVAGAATTLVAGPVAGGAVTTVVTGAGFAATGCVIGGLGAAGTNIVQTSFDNLLEAWSRSGRNKTTMTCELEQIIRRQALAPCSPRSSSTYGERAMSEVQDAATIGALSGCILGPGTMISEKLLPKLTLAAMSVFAFFEAPRIMWNIRTAKGHLVLAQKAEEQGNIPEMRRQIFLARKDFKEANLAGFDAAITAFMAVNMHVGLKEAVTAAEKLSLMVNSSDDIGAVVKLTVDTVKDKMKQFLAKPSP